MENSLAGSVWENYDLFLAYPKVVIRGEVKLRVIHTLIVSPEAAWGTVEVVRSHPQALAQCTEFLEARPGWRREAWSNTAAAVLSITREPEETRRRVAAIGSAEAARLYGLRVLLPGIETNQANFTRFVIIAPGEGLPGEAQGGRPDKASVMFTLEDKPGSLYHCLQVLYENGINLSKIESRPLLGRPWEYLFYLDMCFPEEGAFERARGELEKRTRDFHLLGMYPAAR